MGLTGVLLMISGAAYTFIGIKNKWVYIFCSAAYLASLAVTVLIVYLMNPPVSNAVQGAFFVAAFFSGALFGAASLVFADITEGLGCLLGGFCVSMWFLSVKDGGLITSETGRAIFIGAMSVAGYSLSFSHYTRKYGLIVSMSFAGSTIMMLGIDCFSCSGWKEFWLYLWNLNPGTFPLDTNTYPLTKGIRVELASVILFTLLGIVSQMSLWRIVKEHREKRAEQRREREQDLNREEEQVGRNIQDDFSRERAQWDTIYGEKSPQKDSVIANSVTYTPKTSTSISDKEEVGQGTKLSRGITRTVGQHSQTGATVTVSVLRDDDDIRPIDSNGKALPPQPATVPKEEEGRVNSVPSARPSSDIEPTARCNGMSIRSSRHSSVAVAPNVVPLPFPIPREDDVEDLSDDHASIDAEPESNEGTIPGRKRFSKRLSGTSTTKPLPAIEDFHDDTIHNVQIVPHIEDDRASSIAATFDDEFDQRSLSDVSVKRSSTGSTSEERAESSSTVTSEDVKFAGQPREDASEQTSNDTQEAGTSADKEDKILPEKTVARQSLTVSTDPKPSATVSNFGSPTSSRPQVDTAFSNQGDDLEKTQQIKSNTSGAPSLSSQAGARLSLAKDLLPDKFSKVALTYRTNEWAKHLQHADEPELDELVEPVPLESESQVSQERPAPVSDEIAGIQPVKVKRSSQRISADGSAYAPALNRANSNTSNFSKTSPHVLTRTTSALTLQNMSRSNSQSQYGMRSSSNPHLPNMPLSPVPMANNTLMNQRESLIQNRFSSYSFQNPSTPILPSAMDKENMTLAQRKEAIQRQSLTQTQQKQRPKPPLTSQKWQQSGWGNPGQQTQGFDSHQPRRSSEGQDQVRREDMLASWRESMRQNAASPMQETAVVTDGQRAALMDEKRRKELREQQRAIAAQQRESMLGNMMRSGEMLDAHREAMRRMQRTANKNAS